MTTDLNQWIAELIGWYWSDEFEMWFVKNESPRCTPKELPGYAIDIAPGDAPDWKQRPWTPLTDANQLKVVIERMRELGISFWFEYSEATNWEWYVAATKYRLDKQPQCVVRYHNFNTAVLMAVYEALSNG